MMIASSVIPTERAQPAESCSDPVPGLGSVLRIENQAQGPAEDAAHSPGLAQALDEAELPLVFFLEQADCVGIEAILDALQVLLIDGVVATLLRLDRLHDLVAGGIRLLHHRLDLAFRFGRSLVTLVGTTSDDVRVSCSDRLRLLASRDARIRSRDFGFGELRSLKQPRCQHACGYKW